MPFVGRFSKMFMAKGLLITPSAKFQARVVAIPDADQTRNNWPASPPASSPNPNTGGC